MNPLRSDGSERAVRVRRRAAAGVAAPGVAHTGGHRPGVGSHIVVRADMSMP